jgi:hypothetical protein
VYVILSTLQYSNDGIGIVQSLIALCGSNDATELKSTELAIFINSTSLASITHYEGIIFG